MKPRLLVVSAVFTLGISMHAVAHAGTRYAPYIGTLQIHCHPNLSERAAVDPLEFYGVRPSPHDHTPAGAVAFGSTTTVRKMMAARTSCGEHADHSLLWVPTPLQPNGKPATITTFDYYLINLGYHIGQAPPDGLRFMAGDPHCTGSLCSAIYICQQWDGRILSQHTIPSRSEGCDTRGGQGYGMAVYSPGQCWDGKSLGMGMGASGPAANITAVGRCHERVIPRILAGLSVGADGLGGYLSSDIRAGTTKTSPGSTGHFDYVFGWNRSALTAIIRDCLNTTRFKPGQASCAEVASSKGSTVYRVSWGDHLSKCVTGPSCRSRRSRLHRRPRHANVAREGSVFLPAAALELALARSDYEQLSSRPFECQLTPIRPLDPLLPTQAPQRGMQGPL